MSSRQHRSVWQTAGETASLSNACAMYGLEEEQVIHADPPIPFKVRRCFGNAYCVVKLSDIAALSERIGREEGERRRLLDALGEEEYERRQVAEKTRKEAEEVADKARQEVEARAAEEKRQRDAAVNRLVESLKRVMEFSKQDGAVETLVGLTIAKSTAKKEWDVDVDECGIHPVLPGKSRSRYTQYALADVIKASHDKSGGYRFKFRDTSKPRRQYARFMLDRFREDCEDEEDPTIIKAVVERIRAEVDEKEHKIVDNQAKTEEARELLAEARAQFDALDVPKGCVATDPEATILKRKISTKKGAVTRLEGFSHSLRMELQVAQSRLYAFERLVRGLVSDHEEGREEKMSASSKSKGGVGGGTLDGDAENVENNSKRPAAKKQKVGFAKGLSVASNI